MYSGVTVRVPDPVPPVTAPTMVRPGPGVNVGTELCAITPKMSSAGCWVVTLPAEGFGLLPELVDVRSTVPVLAATGIALTLTTPRPLNLGYVAVTTSPAASPDASVEEQTNSRPLPVFLSATTV